MGHETLLTGLARWIAWRLPHSVVYWAYMRVVAHATSGKWGSEEVGSVHIMDAAKRWGGVVSSAKIT